MPLSRALCRRRCDDSHTFEDAWDRSSWHKWTRKKDPGWICNRKSTQMVIGAKVWETDDPPYDCPFILEHLMITQNREHKESIRKPYSLEEEEALLEKFGLSVQQMRPTTNPMM